MPSKKFPDSIHQDSQELILKIKELITQAVQVKFDDRTSDHPLIFLNAVKNIIGDDKENPSLKLLDISEKYINRFSVRNDDDQILKKVIKDGFGLTVFVDDVEEAIMSGNKETVELEAAKQLLASVKSPAILEFLAQLALHNIDSLGLFTYHWLRSYNFHQEKEILWPYIRAMINEIFKVHLQQQNQGEILKPQDQLNSLLNKYNKGILPTFSAMNRLWNDDYIRIESYRNSISFWLEKTENDDKTETMNSSDLENYIKNGGRYFIDLSEHLLEKYQINAVVQKIVELEGLRGIAKNASLGYFPIIAQCINFTVS
jgi:hypothetical protein